MPNPGGGVGGGGTRRVQKMMTRPVHLIYKFFKQKARIELWLFQQPDLRIEGKIIGFDEYMNIVLDEAQQVNLKKQTKVDIGRIMLKGDNVTLVCNVSDSKQAMM